MSINVEVIGGSPMVQHYVEEIGEPHHLRLVSNSDVFTPTGRAKVGVTWDLSVKKSDADTCELTNMVTVNPCSMVEFPVSVKKTTRKPHYMTASEQEKSNLQRPIT